MEETALLLTLLVSSDNYGLNTLASNKAFKSIEILYQIERDRLPR